MLLLHGWRIDWPRALHARGGLVKSQHEPAASFAQKVQGADHISDCRLNRLPLDDRFKGVGHRQRPPRLLAVESGAGLDPLWVVSGHL